MIDNENEYDKHLNIKTTGRDDSIADLVNYPYEATPYMVLERLANSGYIRKSNTLLDYGSGKGRVDFYLSFQTKCKSIGVEYDKRLYEKSLDNKKTALSKNRVEFVNSDASKYELPLEIDRIYYFNPFCPEILVNTLNNIKESYDRNNRDILLFFYYPSIKYIDILENTSFLKHKDEIDTSDLYDDLDIREKILVYELVNE